MGTLSGDKNEILFSQFGINYNNEPEVFRKGTVLVQNKRSKRTHKHSESNPTEPEGRDYQHITEFNCDIIGDRFWMEHPYVLLGNPAPVHSKATTHSKKELELTV